ncbi:MAG: hypothetical protein JWL64_1853 [Frankiales bacterium]|nr:hypothetical protein [Frankiales bacterium]
MTRTRTAQVGLLVVAALLAAAFALPHVLGAGWGQALLLIGTLHAWQLGCLLGLWGAGLWVHAFVARAALPGLTHPQALVLNMTGSAVTNALPLGGPVSMGLKYRMVRSWGFATGAFAPLIAVCSATALAVKLALPVAALGLLLLSGGIVTPGLRWAAVAALAMLAVVVAALVVLLVSRELLAGLARAAQRVADRWLVRAGSDRSYDLERALLQARDRTELIARAEGRRLLGASVAHALLQALLFAAVLAMLGSPLGPAQVLAGFAVGRVLTLVGLTPGGIGIAETGSASVLIALGGDPAAVAAALIVFGAFTYLLPIPLGGLCVLGWRRRQQLVPVAVLSPALAR